MSKSLEALKARVSTDARAQAFGTGFVSAYLGQAFGTLPKTEIDLLVFGLLIETGALSADQPVYEIARSLNVTPAKARSLLFQHQLRTMDDDALNTSVRLAVRHGRYSVDGRSLSLGVESPLVRSAIDARSKTRGVFADISLSGEILRIPMTQFGTFLEAFLSDDQKANLTRRLQAAGVLDRTGLAATLNRVGVFIAGKVADETASAISDRVTGFFSWTEAASTTAGNGIPAEILQYFG